MHDLRCTNGILFARLGGGVIEVKCRSRRCGYEPGVVVLHRFDVLTGEIMGTEIFKDPAHNLKVVNENDKSAVRTS